MSSESQENNINRTSCKDCILAIYSDKTQTGCQANRIEKYKAQSKDLVFEAYDEEKEFFVINRLCNFYRDKSWNNGQASISKINNECKVTFEVLIDCKDFDKEDIAQFRSLYNDMTDYGEKKISTILFVNHKSKVRSIFDNRSVIGSPQTVIYFDELNLHTHVIQARQSYHILINKTNIHTSDDIFNVVNNKINMDLNRIIAFEYNNIIGISNLAYKVESFKLESIDYKKIINSVIENSKKENFYFIL